MPEDPINGHFNSEILLCLNVPGDAPYHPCSEAFPAEEVPRSIVTHLADWDQSSVYPETRRDIRISLPAKLDGEMALLVCQDGKDYVDSNGAVRAVEVLDTLMHSGDIPPTVGVFVDPGKSDTVPRQRNVEYDTMDDTYVTFIDDEILPLVESTVMMFVLPTSIFIVQLCRGFGKSQHSFHIVAMPIIMCSNSSQCACASLHCFNPSCACTCVVRSRCNE